MKKSTGVSTKLHNHVQSSASLWKLFAVVFATLFLLTAGLLIYKTAEKKSDVTATSGEMSESESEDEGETETDESEETTE